MKIKNKMLISTLSAVALFTAMSFPVNKKNNTNPFSLVHTVYAKSQDVEALSSRIEALPALEDIKESDGKEVTALMKMYKELSIAEKIDVPNYEKLENLYNKLVEDGIITDEEKNTLEEEEIAKNQQQGKEASDKNVEAKTQEFVFDIDDGDQSTIIARFTGDSDGNGQQNIPDRIVLTSPDGKTYPITNTSVTMQDAGVMKIDLTWTSNFLQLDFTEAKPGRWSINTSEPVTFSQTPYAGAMKNIKAEDHKKKDMADIPAENNSNEGDLATSSNKKEKGEDDGGFSVGSLFVILGLGGGIVFALVKMKNNTNGTTQKSAGNNNKKVDKYNENIDIPDANDDISDEELLAEMQEISRKNNVNKNQNDDYDVYDNSSSSYSDNFNSTSYNENIENNHNEPASQNNDYDFEMQEYEESGDTGLLKKEDQDQVNDQYEDFDDDFTKF